MAVVAWLKDSAGQMMPNWNEFEPLYQKARSLSFDLWNMAVDELDAFLAARISDYKNQRIFALTGSAIALFFACLISFFVLRSITGPVGHLVGVMKQLAQGDSSARANLKTTDEVGQLARQFDSMVDEREAVSAKIQKENDQLNESVLLLLQAVSQLAKKDLTVSIPVAKDVTGPISDALNMVTQETARVLGDVVNVADYVAQASRQVKLRSSSAMSTADTERQQVEKAAADLNTASETMLRVAKLALACNAAAEKAIQTTDQAQKTVLGTVSGITTIRDTIRETEKRIKRLGERSQEISGVVSLINSIAERTHILALNASMHAASAGEAGRGFAVVADEVQRLAENAREATSKIAGLVHNIQVETADTVTTMNEAISQVVSGTQLAEQAGAQMNETRENTENLVKMVAQIAKHAQIQAQTSKRLSDEAEGIRQSTQKTTSELNEQATYTDQLVALSGSLVEAVQVFTLPKSQATGGQLKAA
jgi:methyl-accepting chemotaxis protein